ncbi:MAG: T9SS type A sorting domain-containing protein, partial [Bacteroidetes bacterium]|nr:T9SS type A sorting domain-containing protein [Bacteroidota bacterium]
PNPFNPTTVISYHLPAGQAGLPVVSAVDLRVFDMLGREVAVLVDGWQNPGTYQVPFDGSRLSSGTYVARLTAGGMMSTIRMMLIK